MKNLPRIKIIFSIICITACTSNQKAIIADKTDVSTEIEKAIVSASESIIAKLPPNSTVALFNNSAEETDLTNHVIEEISSYLTDKSSLIIVEREKFEILEIEQNWQMGTGYVPDEEQVSIAGRMGARYVVSSFISGSGHLQRLRIKTWNLGTGQTIVSNAYPTNVLGEQFIQETRIKPVVSSERKDSEDNSLEFQTFRENGITIDYSDYRYNDRENDIDYYAILFEIYIDGTHDFFACLVENTKRINSNIISSFFYSPDIPESEMMTTQIFEYIENFALEVDFEDISLPALSKAGVNRRNINIIPRMLKKILIDSFS